MRVNGVNPGIIKTEIFQKAGITGEMLEQLMEKTRKNHLLGRIGTVEEVSGMITFLASDEARFITGQTIGIDGGRALKI